MITIYHNSRCQKSRHALQHIENFGEEINVVDYLKNPPSPEELRKILRLLEIPAFELIRKKEELFKIQFKDKQYSEDQWINVMVKNPVLIERPIIIKGKMAVIGRDEVSLQKIN